MEEHIKIINEACESTKRQLDLLKSFLNDGKSVLKSGIEFLEVKYHLLLDYCMNLNFYSLLKTKGVSVKNHPVIERLIEIRYYY